MRSRYLLNFRNQLSELNNCLSHYIFVWNQFYLDNSAIILKQSNDPTIVVYPDNQSSNQFNVKLKYLNSSHGTTIDFILKSLFLSTYTQFEAYIRDFYELARKADPSLSSLNYYDSVPDKIFDNLGIDKSDLFEKDEICTLQYIRLRRNRIVHTSGEVKGELADLSRNHGTHMNIFWDSILKSGRSGINFKLSSHDKDGQHNVSHFKKEEIFDLIRIWRILVDKIDNAICGRIGNESIIHQLRQEFDSENELNIKNWDSKKTARKFRAYCRIEFDINMDSK